MDSPYLRLSAFIYTFFFKIRLCTNEKSTTPGHLVAKSMDFVNRNGFGGVSSTYRWDASNVDRSNWLSNYPS